MRKLLSCRNFETERRNATRHDRHYSSFGRRQPAARLTAATGISVSLTLGPAGLLRERIEAGETFDLFASANMAHPRRLAEIGIAEPPIRFATNRLCIVARSSLSLGTENMLDVLAAPDCCETTPITLLSGFHLSLRLRSNTALR